MYQEHLQTLDIHFRKFCRSIVGPPPYIDWTLARHEILNTWNERAAHFVRVARIESWSRMCCGSYWKLAPSCCSTPHSPLDTKSFALATRAAKATRTSRNYAGRAKWRCTVVTTDCFFLPAFFTAECSVARTVLLVSFQALGTMLAIFLFFFFPPLLFSRRRSIDTGLLYWAASRHRLFLYWPVSRCACGREGVSPDLPLPCWEATDRHGWARV